MDADRLKRILIQQADQWQAAGVQVVPRQSAIAIPTTTPATPGPIEPQPAEQGLREMPKPKKNLDKPASTQAQGLPELTSASEPWPTELAALPESQRTAQLDILKTKVAGCTLCTELANSRTQTVFGVGSSTAKIAFFGEAPGADEDRQGEPFVGRAGKLLTQIIEACGFQRSDVYILNTLKCRPPGNRNPTQEENNNCRPYFERQLEIVQPDYIVCLGRFAINNLLETAAPIGKLRGQFHNYRGSKVVVTYHPAYLLRNPSAKKEVWEDMKMMLSDMGLPIPTKK